MNENPDVQTFRSDFSRISMFFLAFSKTIIFGDMEMPRGNKSEPIFVRTSYVEQILGEYWPGEYRQVGEIL